MQDKDDGPICSYSSTNQATDYTSGKPFMDPAVNAGPVNRLSVSVLSTPLEMCICVAPKSLPSNRFLSLPHWVLQQIFFSIDSWDSAGKVSGSVILFLPFLRVQFHQYLDHTSAGSL